MTKRFDQDFDKEHRELMSIKMAFIATDFILQPYTRQIAENKKGRFKKPAFKKIEIKCLVT